MNYLIINYCTCYLPFLKKKSFANQIILYKIILSNNVRLHHFWWSRWFFNLVIIIIISFKSYSEKQNVHTRTPTERLSSVSTTRLSQCLSQKIFPHNRQWCLRERRGWRIVENTTSQPGSIQCEIAWSGIHCTI